MKQIIKAIGFTVAVIITLTLLPVGESYAGNQTFKEKYQNIGLVQEKTTRPRAHTTNNNCFVHYWKKRRNRPDVYTRLQVKCSVWEDCDINDMIVLYTWVTLDSRGRVITSNGSSGSLYYCA